MSQPLSYETPVRSPVPTVLKVVACLFIAGGIISLTGMVTSAVYGRLDLDFNVLGIFVGLGLLRLSPGWRTCGLFLIWCGLVGLPLVALFVMLVNASFAIVRWNGQIVGHVPIAVMFIPIAMFWVLAFWMYRVLTRPDVRSLFFRCASGDQSRSDIVAALERIPHDYQGMEADTEEAGEPVLPTKGQRT